MTAGEHADPLEARITHLRSAFLDRFGAPPEGVATAPGRVNLIGEHLDYNDGLVLPVAIDRSVLVAYARRNGETVSVHSLDHGEESCFAAGSQIARDDRHRWSNYVRGTFDVARCDGFALHGLDLMITGNIPEGAGLSSSAALTVATLGALRAAYGLDLDNGRLARLAQRAENEFVGVQCGIMDQLAATLSVADHALLIDCRSLAVELVPLPLEEQGITTVVVDSGVRRRLEDSRYNVRREECTAALQALRDAMPSSQPEALRDVTEDDLRTLTAALPEMLLRRAQHVVTELRRVEEAADALRAGQFAAFGGLMNASHASLRDNFEVSCDELDRLAELAQAREGVLGSRLTGAGFGGCTVNLVRDEALPAFREHVVRRYASESGRAARMLVCAPSDGLRLYAGTA